MSSRPFWRAAIAAIPAAQRLTDEQSRREPPEQLFRAGMELFAAEKFERAAEEFTKATRGDPLFTLAYYQAGQSYMNLQRYPSAIKAFQQCIESTRALYDLAQTDRFSVEKQRDDEIREMRESIIAMQHSRRGVRQRLRAARAAGRAAPARPGKSAYVARGRLSPAGGSAAVARQRLLPRR